MKLRMAGRILFIAVLAGLLSIAGLIGYARLHHRMILGVQTASMRPALRPGDAVLVGGGNDQITIGDIVTYQSLESPNVTITHRIVSFKDGGETVVTKGDALAVADPPLARSQVLGRVQRVIPYGGYASAVFRSPVGLVAAVYLPAVFLIVVEIKRLVRYYNRRYFRIHYY